MLKFKIQYIGVTTRRLAEVDLQCNIPAVDLDRTRLAVNGLLKDFLGKGNWKGLKTNENILL